MKVLPNGLKIFNATPHVIRFWCKEWDGPVEVETDTIVSAAVIESSYPPVGTGSAQTYSLRVAGKASFVCTGYVPTDGGAAIVRDAYQAGADLVVGSIIAAQAYPGVVVAMTPAPGYERVPPAEKRMSPDKFTVY